MNILAIGSHHDDVEFGCFGTLSKHKENGDNVYVEGYNDTFNVTMYENNSFQYIPYL